MMKTVMVLHHLADLLIVNKGERHVMQYGVTESNTVGSSPERRSVLLCSLSSLPSVSRPSV